MKRLLITLLAIAGLILMPLRGYADMVAIPSGDAPPVAQPLVREGDFAVALVKALNLGAPQDETDAENILISHGIAPRNGWISDYPVTPDIFGDLHNAVTDAAGAQQLPMSTDDALAGLQTVAESFGLQVVADTSGGNTQHSGPPDTYSGENQTEITTYYDDYGPPVITYYPPPYEYGYLYAWVPYPFWYDGFFFTGYFCLHDFDRIIVVPGGHRVITNHWIDHDSRRVVLINPVTRRFERHFRTEGGFSSPHARSGAEAIYHRSFGHGDGHIRDMDRREGHFGGFNGADHRAFGRQYHNEESHPAQLHNDMVSRFDHDGVNRGARFSGPSRSGSVEGLHDNDDFGHGGSFRGWQGGAPEGFHGGGFHGGGFGYRR